MSLDAQSPKSVSASRKRKPAEAVQVSRDASLPTPPAEDASLIDWALYLAEFGRLTGAFKVFPCGANKRPLHKRRQNEAGEEEGWKEEATNDPAKIKAWQTEASWCAIGLAIQPGFAAIDVDRYKPGAKEILAAFEAKHGKFPATFKSLTASGGEHYLFETDKVSGNGTGDLPDCIDVRGHGGYIIGPGSTFEGKRYKLDRLMPPVSMPEYLEALIGETKRRDRSKPDEPAHLVVVDHPRNIQAYTDWCAGNPVETLATPHGEVAEPCIEGKRGNNMLAKTGAMGRDYGLSAHVALDIALEHHNPRCVPTWDDDQYEYHFLSGYKSATGRLGWRAPYIDTSKLFKPVPMKERGPKPGDPAPPDAEKVAFADLVRYFEGVLRGSGNQEISINRFEDIEDEKEEPAGIIDGWLSPEAVSIMFGESQSFKTYITINMLLCVATGRAWAKRDGFEGYKVGEPREVVLFAGEGYEDAKQRVKAAIKDGEFTAEERKLIGLNLIMARGVYALNRPDGLAGMATALAKLKARPAVIAVDTFNLGLDGDEDSAEEIKKATLGLRNLAEKYEAAGLILDHVGHGEGAKGRPKGSYAKIGNSDGMIQVKRDGKTKRVTLSQTKNRFDDIEGYVATFEGSSIDFGGPKPKLAFRAIEPVVKPDKDSNTEKPTANMAYVANTIRILGKMSGLPIKRGSLAKEAVNASNPELCKDPAAFERACETFGKYLSRVREGHQLWPYVDTTTLNFGAPMNFLNPFLNGHRGKQPRRRRADIEPASCSAAKGA